MKRERNPNDKKQIKKRKPMKENKESNDSMSIEGKTRIKEHGFMDYQKYGEEYLFKNSKVIRVVVISKINHW